MLWRTITTFISSLMSWAGLIGISNNVVNGGHATVVGTSFTQRHTARHLLGLLVRSRGRRALRRKSRRPGPPADLRSSLKSTITVTQPAGQASAAFTASQAASPCLSTLTMHLAAVCRRRILTTTTKSQGRLTKEDSFTSGGQVQKRRGCRLFPDKTGSGLLLVELTTMGTLWVPAAIMDSSTPTLTLAAQLSTRAP